MKNFALGPVEMFSSTLEVAAQPVPYFRTPEFSDLMLETDGMFKECLGAPAGTKIVYLTASGTAAMEATVFNCFDESSKLLIVDGGIFGHRFTMICDKFRIPYEKVELAFGEVLTPERLEPFDGTGFDALLVNVHETSTGQLYDIHMLSDFCKRNGAYLVVDAISSFLADSYDMEGMGIDATILSSQKGLALGPGMSFVALSPRIYEERVKKTDPPSLYFDFKDYIENFKRGQTPYTPAVRVAFELNDMLKLVLDEGLGNRLAHMAQLAQDFRGRISNIEGVRVPEWPLSNACTPILFDRLNAQAVYRDLKENHDVVLTPCGGDLTDVMVRMGHIGNHTLAENEFVAGLLETSLRKEG